MIAWRPEVSGMADPQAVIDFLATLSAQDDLELDRVVLALEEPAEEDLTVRTVVRGWAHDIRRLEADALLSGDDYDGWTEYDWFAVGYSRRRLEFGLSLLSAAVRPRVARFVGTLDERFRELTEPDPMGVVNMLFSVLHKKPQPESEWWWWRVPIRGSIRECMEAFVQRHSP